jgi:hypothetical protein
VRGAGTVIKCVSQAIVSATTNTSSYFCIVRLAISVESTTTYSQVDKLPAKNQKEGQYLERLRTKKKEMEFNPKGIDIAMQEDGPIFVG